MYTLGSPIFIVSNMYVKIHQNTKGCQLPLAYLSFPAAQRLSNQCAHNLAGGCQLPFANLSFAADRSQ